MAHTSGLSLPRQEKNSADRPILDIAASLWDADRYAAFLVCYRSMRRLDDLVDHRREQGEPISPQEARVFSNLLTDWLAALKRESLESDIAAVNDYRAQFHIPLWPWERLVAAMQYDLTHQSFPSWLIFRRYCEGAAIAPASIFIYLTMTEPSRLSPSEARHTASSLALFAYLVHIIRDLHQDLERGLFYLPDAWLARHGLSQLALQLLFAENPEPDDPRLARFLREYADVVRWYELRAVAAIRQRAHLFLPTGAQSLQLVRHLYGLMARRLYEMERPFVPGQLHLKAAEIDAAVAAAAHPI